MNFSSLADWQTTLVTTLVAGLMGIIGSLLVKWYDKRKLPREEDRESFTHIIDAAKENVTMSQMVVNILEDRLKTERDYFGGLIDRSKNDCESKIDEMKKEYDDTMSDLQAQIIKGQVEKEAMSKQIEKLTEEKTDLQREVFELKERLKRYDQASFPPTDE